jgi:hypothetical protein
MRTYATMIILALAAAAAMFAADAKAGSALRHLLQVLPWTRWCPNATVAKMMKVEMKDLKSSEIQGMSDVDIAGVVTKGKGRCSR